MGTVRNILFIMCDQLRADYISCNGHPTLHTPHLDALAARGVNFTRAYCQSPVCGPSRMSFYTGRYMFCHGATWNNVPLSVGAWTMGDYLRPLGLRRCSLAKPICRVMTKAWHGCSSMRSLLWASSSASVALSRMSVMTACIRIRAPIRIWPITAIYRLGVMSATTPGTILPTRLRDPTVRC